MKGVNVTYLNWWGKPWSRVIDISLSESCTTTKHHHHRRHVFISKISEFVEFRQNNFAKIRSVFFSHFCTLNSKLGKMHSLFNWPILNGWIKHLIQSTFLNRSCNMVTQTHWWLRCYHLQKHDPKWVNIRLGSKHARLLVLRINVTESSSGCCHAIVSRCLQLREGQALPALHHWFCSHSSGRAKCFQVSSHGAPMVQVLSGEGKGDRLQSLQQFEILAAMVELVIYYYFSK